MTKTLLATLLLKAGIAFAFPPKIRKPPELVQVLRPSVLCAGAVATDGYGQVADTYDLHSDKNPMITLYKARVQPIERLLARMLPGQRTRDGRLKAYAMDLGVGTGGDLEFLEGEFTKVFGIDSSAAMISKAREKIHRPNTSLYVGDILTTPIDLPHQRGVLPAGLYNYVHSVLCMKYFHNLRKFFRVLREIASFDAVVFITDTSDVQMEIGGSRSWFPLPNGDRIYIRSFIHYRETIIEEARRQGFELIQAEYVDFDDKLKAKLKKERPTSNFDKYGENVLFYFVFKKVSPPN